MALTFREFPPDPLAAAYVEQFWLLSGDRGPWPADPCLVTPDGCIEFVFALDGAPVELPHAPDGAADRVGDVFVLGITTEPFYASYRGSVCLFGARVAAPAAVRLFGADLSAIRDRALPLTDFAPTLASMWRSIRASPRVAAPQIAREFCLALNRHEHRGDPYVAEALTRISSAAGSICLSRLSREVGISSRHLDRCFDRVLGLCPKLFCRIARFRAAWEQGFSRRDDWAAIAADCGYADQAHLCREFREFAGLSPTQTASLG